MPITPSEAHQVTFLSPGHIFAKQNTLPISQWNIHAAIGMADEIAQANSAQTPFAFFFTTRTTEEDGTSTERARSGRYFLSGEVQSMERVEQEQGAGSITYRNMINNGYQNIISGSLPSPWSTAFKTDDMLMSTNPTAQQAVRDLDAIDTEQDGQEAAHATADDTILNVLNALGHSQVVAAYRRVQDRAKGFHYA